MVTLVQQGGTGKVGRRIIPAVPAGMEGFFLLGDSIELSCRNLIQGKPDAVAVGSPTVGSNYLGLTTADFLQTRIEETTAMSALIVLRTDASGADNTTRPRFFGNAGSQPAKPGVTGLIGLNFNMSAAGSLSLAAPRYTDGTETAVTTSTQTQSTGLTFTEWQAAIMKVSQPLSGFRIPKFSISRMSSEQTLVRALAAGLMRIGATYSSTGGPSSIAAVLVWSRYLTTGEEDAALAQVRSILAKRGLQSV